MQPKSYKIFSKSHKQMILTLLVLVVASVLYGGATTAQSGCKDALTSLSPCIDYVTDGSSSPSSDCCNQFSMVVQSSPECLCSIVNSSGTSFSGFKFNGTLALNLPATCNVQTPSPNQCYAGSIGPTTSPTNSPKGSPQGVLSPSGSKRVSWSSESSSNRNVIILSLLSSIALVLAKI